MLLIIVMIMINFPLINLNLNFIITVQLYTNENNCHHHVTDFHKLAIVEATSSSSGTQRHSRASSG